MSNAGLNSLKMDAFITPFPTFTSRHLQTDRHGRVINRDILTLREHDSNRIGIMAYCHQNQSELLAFNTQFLTARWMCSDPERRLYTEEFYKNKVEDDAISVQIDVESQAGM